MVQPGYSKKHELADFESAFEHADAEAARALTL
jgi:hypothetical protein